MRNFFTFLILFFASLLDVSFFSRFHIFRFSISISLFVIIIFAIYSKTNKDCFWVIIPAAIYGIFSKYNLAELFVVFTAIYFLTKFIAIEFKKFFKKDGFRPV